MQDLYPRPRSPFDANAMERLRRMGLADADGRADPYSSSPCGKWTGNVKEPV